MRMKDALGRFGEDTAVRFLQDAGLEVLDRNWRCPEGELDIVAREGRVLVVVEVKARSGTGFGTPAEAVTPAKAARLRRLTVRWIDAHRATGTTRPGQSSGVWDSVRIDVVSVLRDRRSGLTVDHLVGVL